MFRFLRPVSRPAFLVWTFGVLAFCFYAALLVFVGLHDIGIGPKLLLSGAGGACVVTAILCNDHR